MNRIMYVALALALTLGVLGCASATEPVDDAPATPSAEPMDFTQLDGVWDMTTTLIYVDDIEYREALEQPEQRWECTVDGERMTLATDTQEFVGTLTSEGSDRWSFVGGAEYTDEDGESWTSSIEIRAFFDESGAIIGKMERIVTPVDADPLYAAQWDFTGTRGP